MFHHAQCNHSYITDVNHSLETLCNDSYMETIGERIVRLRKERNLSQLQVANAAQVSRVAVTKWESGATKNLKLENLLAMCDLFGVSAEELISGIETVTQVHQDRATYIAKSNQVSVNNEERLLLTAYRKKSRAEQLMILKILDIDYQDFAQSA